jgi:alpha-N-acetylglucosamine transferase
MNKRLFPLIIASAFAVMIFKYGSFSYVDIFQTKPLSALNGSICNSIFIENRGFFWQLLNLTIKYFDFKSLVIKEKEALKLLKGCKNNVTYKHKHAAWTFLTDGDGYALALNKLLSSIRRHTTIEVDLLVLEQSNKPIKSSVSTEVEALGAQICQVDRIAPLDEAGTQARFRDQFTKIRFWEMSEYESCVYFDLDCLVIRNIDYLFNVHKLFHPTNHKIGICRDYCGGRWLETFNTGVFVIKPDRAQFERLLKLNNDPNFKFPTFFA